MNEKNITAITVGASAGGLNALCEFVAQLPTELDAAVFIVLHLSRTGIGDYLAQRLRQHTDWTCVLADNNIAVEKGHIYIARVNKHMLVKDGHIVLGAGPAENRWRPSIDVLFRSSAVEYKENVIGIILTGLLNDGTAGMSAIKQCGGLAIVQDPNEAEYPDMPLSVIENMEADEVVPLAQMGKTILKLMQQEKKSILTIPPGIAAESSISERVVTGIENVSELGEKTLFACPDCGGGLWKMGNKNADEHYRCHFGHAYSEKDLALKQVEAIEATLWVAVRMMEERKMLLSKMSAGESSKGLKKISDLHAQSAEELETHINKLKKLLYVTAQEKETGTAALKNAS